MPCFTYTVYTVVSQIKLSDNKPLMTLDFSVLLAIIATLSGLHHNLFVVFVLVVLVLAFISPGDEYEVRSELCLYGSVHAPHLLLEAHAVKLLHHHARLESAQVPTAVG